jgi:high-affinity Fe2+/Pb2+ permease
MFAQNLFYYTVSTAIIVITVFICLILIYWLMVLRKISDFFDRLDNIATTIKEKIQISAFMGLVGQGIKEVIEFIREKRKPE